MFRSFRNIPIFSRLFLAFALAALIPGIVIALLGSNYIYQLTSRGQAIQVSNRAVKIATTELAELQRMNALLNGLFTTDPEMATLTQSLKDQIIELKDNFDEQTALYGQDYQIATASNMSTVRDHLLSEDPTGHKIADQQKTLDQVLGGGELWIKYDQAQTDAIIASQSLPSATQTAAKLLDIANTRYDPLEKSWQHVVDLSEAVSGDIASVTSTDINPILWTTVVALLSTIMLIITIGYLINLTITRPLRQLATLTKRISRGDTGARVMITGRDEIYMVATSMNNMLDNIVRLIQEAQSQRDLLQGQVEKLVSEVSGVGEGDLRVQAEVTADALGVLADSFNYMVEELGSLVVHVKMVAHEVENSTVGILDRMSQLVETGDIQINQIAEAAIEVEHMADSSHQVADRAQILYNVAHEARQNAQSGREAVQQAVEGMGRIHENVQTTSNQVQLLGERSREINNIVDVISNIAHQTNRLALDAAIQAAMAGENGKGFGAVAADIRRLAERAKDQAGMIARIVRSVREDIGAAAVAMQDTERETSAGARLTQEAGTALESIFTAVEHQARAIENINQMATQQLQSSSAVVQIMHGVSESTQQSSASTRAASQNMERLARLVEQLRASVEAFKLRENQGTAVPASYLEYSPAEEEQDNQMTVSGIFRTVTALPPTAGTFNALPPARSAAPFAFYPVASVPQNDAWGAPPQQRDTWGAPPSPVSTEQGWYDGPVAAPQPNNPWGAWSQPIPTEQQWYGEPVASPQPNNPWGAPPPPVSTEQGWYSEPFDERTGNGNRRG